jgi:RHS repeat-associated protein
LFSGKERDAETGFYDFGARYYNPKYSRWLSVDTILSKYLDRIKDKTVNPADWEVYSYCKNNPIIYVDPDGKEDRGFAYALLSWLCGKEEADKWYNDPALRGFFGVSDTMTDTALSYTQARDAKIAVTGSDFTGTDQNRIYAVAGLMVGILSSKVFGKTLRELSEAHLTNNGVTVLGHMEGVAEDYITKAKRLGASYFDVGPDAWKAMTAEQRTVANMHFLDKIAEKQDKILLNVARNEIRPGSALAGEIEYLTTQKGYKWVNQYSLRFGGTH